MNEFVSMLRIPTFLILIEMHTFPSILIFSLISVSTAQFPDLSCQLFGLPLDDCCTKEAVEELRTNYSNLEENRDPEIILNELREKGLCRTDETTPDESITNRTDGITDFNETTIEDENSTISTENTTEMMTTEITAETTLEERTKVFTLLPFSRNTKKPKEEEEEMETSTTIDDSTTGTIPTTTVTATIEDIQQETSRITDESEMSSDYITTTKIETSSDNPQMVESTTIEEKATEAKEEEATTNLSEVSEENRIGEPTTEPISFGSDETTKQEDSTSSSSSPITIDDDISSSEIIHPENEETNDPTTNLPGETTEYWPSSGTTKILDTGEIVVSERVTAFENCTTLLEQLVYNPQTKEYRTISSVDPEGCKESTVNNEETTTIKASSHSNPVEETTQMIDSWPSGTTRTLPSGEIVLSERITTFENCTTVLEQFIHNPADNTNRTETVTDPDGCKTTQDLMETTQSEEGKTSTSPPTTSNPDEWPNSGTTKTLPTGEIILSERVTSFENCTTILEQFIHNPADKSNRTNVVTDPEGCKNYQSSTVEDDNVGTTQLPDSATDWPKSGTTRTLPSGEIILSEKVTSFENCTTILDQFIHNPADNTNRTETVTDPEGCKLLTTRIPDILETRTSSEEDGEMETTIKVTEWPKIGTTKTLPSGEIILSERVTSFENCTTILEQFIHNPADKSNRTNVVTDPEGCKNYQSTTVENDNVETTQLSDSATEWPKSGTTRTLPSGEIILSEKVTSFENCTTILEQFIHNPADKSNRTNVVTDPEGCKLLTTTIPDILETRTSFDEDDTTKPAVTWPPIGTTKTLPNGEIILSERVTAFDNCTTILEQLIFNPATKQNRTNVISDPEGCLATKTTNTRNCPRLEIDLTNSMQPKEEELKDVYEPGELIIHVCNPNYVFEHQKMPLLIYTCLPSGDWSNSIESCTRDKHEL